MKFENERVKKYRTALNLSPEYVAKYLGITVEEYEKIEAGEFYIFPDEAEKLEALFGAPVNGPSKDSERPELKYFRKSFTEDKG